MIVAIPVIIVMVALNALYVAGEFAAVSARRTKLREAAEAGNRMARWMLPVVEDGQTLDRYVAGCQIGITLSSLLLGAYAQAAIVPGLADLLSGDEPTRASTVALSSTVMLLVTTATQVIFGELIPKSVALQAPTQTAILTAWPVRVSLWVFRPLIAVLNGSGILLLRLLRAPTSGHRHIHSPGEISLLIAESADGGLLSDDEQERLDRALRLGLLPVRRLMVPRMDIIGVEQDETLDATLQRFASSGFTRLPVYLGTLDHIVGTIHAKEVAHRVVAGGAQGQAREVMRPIASVPESMRAEQLVAELRRQRSEQAVVVDEHGSVAGLVTLEDLLGEVLGATDPEEEGALKHLADGRVRLSGRVRVDEAREALGILWEGDSDTVGGIVSERLGHIPTEGECLEIDGIEVEVETVEGLVVRSIIATPLSAAAESAR